MVRAGFAVGLGVVVVVVDVVVTNTALSLKVSSWERHFSIKGTSSWGLFEIEAGKQISKRCTIHDVGHAGLIIDKN